MSLIATEKPSLRSWLHDEAPASPFQAWVGGAWRVFVSLCRSPLALAGLIIVGLLVLMALFAPLITLGVSPNEQDLATRLTPPGAAHWFGTDELGRDIFAPHRFMALASR